MDRRTSLKLLGAALGSVFAANFGSTAFAEEKLTAELLKKKLYAKTQSEKDFIDLVFHYKSVDKLSEKSIYAAYRYAIKRRNTRFQYFKTSIKKLAKKEGLDL